MPGPTPAIMAIAFLAVVVVVEDILFLILFNGGFSWEGGSWVLFFFSWCIVGRGMNEMSFDCRWENSFRGTREKLKENKLEFAFSIYVLV